VKRSKLRSPTGGCRPGLLPSAFFLLAFASAWHTPRAAGLRCPSREPRRGAAAARGLFLVSLSHTWRGQVGPGQLDLLGLPEAPNSRTIPGLTGRRSVLKAVMTTLSDVNWRRGLPGSGPEAGTQISGCEQSTPNLAASSDAKAFVRTDGIPKHGWDLPGRRGNWCAVVIHHPRVKLCDGVRCWIQTSGLVCEPIQVGG